MENNLFILIKICLKTSRALTYGVKSNWIWGTQEIDRECVRWQTKMENRIVSQNNNLQIWLEYFFVEENQGMFCSILNDFHEDTFKKKEFWCLKLSISYLENLLKWIKWIIPFSNCAVSSASNLYLKCSHCLRLSPRHNHRLLPRIL
jgi:hypothetical protein